MFNQYSNAKIYRGAWEISCTSENHSLKFLYKVLYKKNELCMVEMLGVDFKNIFVYNQGNFWFYKYSKEVYFEEIKNACIDVDFMARLTGVSMLFVKWFPGIFFYKKLPPYYLCENEKKYTQWNCKDKAAVLFDGNEIKKIKYALGKSYIEAVYLDEY